MTHILIPKPEWVRYGDEFEFSWPSLNRSVIAG